MKKVSLLIIDPQNDFCHPDGSLYVPGSPDDLLKISKLLDTVEEGITDIHVSLDMHNIVDISHPCWFINKNGDNPAPFAQINRNDLCFGGWEPVGNINSTENYLESLEAFGKKHTIWPYHCLVGSWGANVVSWIGNRLNDIAMNMVSNVNYHIKGLNPLTEHFSIISAICPLDADISTQVNWSLLDSLHESDMILICGEASSHCVAESVRDIICYFQDYSEDHYHEICKKIYLLKDAISPVKGFENLEKEFFEEASKKGVNIITSEEILNII